jgi:hypothetical protein
VPALSSPVPRTMLRRELSRGPFITLTRLAQGPWGIVVSPRNGLERSRHRGPLAESPMSDDTEPLLGRLVLVHQLRGREYYTVVIRGQFLWWRRIEAIKPTPLQGDSVLQPGKRAWVPKRAVRRIRQKT